MFCEEFKLTPWHAQLYFIDSASRNVEYIFTVTARGKRIEKSKVFSGLDENRERWNEESMQVFGKETLLEKVLRYAIASGVEVV